MFRKLNGTLIIAVAILGLVTGLFLTVNKEIKKNFELQTKQKELFRQDSLKGVKIKDLMSYDTLNRKAIGEIQTTLKTYRDSFLLVKSGIIYKDRIITINKSKGLFGKTTSIDTTIVNKISYK